MADPNDILNAPATPAGPPGVVTRREARKDPSLLTPDAQIRLGGHRTTVQEALDAIAFAKQSGIGERSAFKAERRLNRKYGIDAATGVEGYTSHAPTTQTEFDRLIPVLRTGSPDSRKSVMRESFNTYFKEKMLQEGRDQYEKTTGPVLTDIQTRLQDMLSKPVNSAEEVGRLRAEITGLAQAQSSSRQKRIAATLGIRGIGADSPAGLALAQRDAEEMDRTVVDQFRQLGIDLDQMEQDAQTSNLALASGFEFNKAGFERGMTTGDTQLLGEASTNLSGLLEAIIAQKNQSSADKRALRASILSGGLQGIGSIGSAVGQVGSLFKGGGGGAMPVGPVPV